MEFYFQVFGVALLLALALVAAVMSMAVCGHFSTGERLHPAWRLIASGAACDIAGLVCRHLLGARNSLNALFSIPQISEPLAGRIRDSGTFLSGTCRMAILAGGFAYALRAYRSAGFLGRLAKIDRLLVAGAGLYVLREAWDTFVQIRRGAAVTTSEVMSWPVDPLLCVLLVEALLLFRSVRLMGKGRIGRTWQAFSAGLFLLVLGDAGLWATAYGYLPWPWSSVTWYFWVPAAAAFALAPLYQLEAIYEAEAPRSSLR